MVSPQKVDPVDVNLCLRFLGRLITRDEKDPFRRNVQRIQFLRNFTTVEAAPDAHLAAAVRVLSQGGGSFGVGLIIGFTAALASRGGDPKQTLELMAKDLAASQDCPPPIKRGDRK